MVNEEMYYEVEPIQPLGICKALYAFDGKITTMEFLIQINIKWMFIWYLATSEGSIPMAEGEELHVIELDQGDGWTRVCIFCV